jgi:hypothetical protein
MPIRRCGQLRQQSYPEHATCEVQAFKYIKKRCLNVIWNIIRSVRAVFQRCRNSRRLTVLPTNVLLAVEYLCDLYGLFTA